MSELVVRIGNQDDVDGIMKLALAGTEENGFLSPNPVKILHDVWAALSLDNGIIGIIGERGSEPEGAILLRISKMWYSDEDILEERAIYIRPEFRNAKGGRAKRLCAFSREVSDKLGLPLIIGVLSNHRTEAKVRLYTREFGNPAGAFFLHGCKTGQLGKAAAE